MSHAKISSTQFKYSKKNVLIHYLGGSSHEIYEILILSPSNIIHFPPFLLRRS